MSMSRVKVRGAVGDGVVRIDGVPKVTGSFTFASDLHRDGMLWGATVRSPLPHARVRSVDVSRAVATPGVAAESWPGMCPEKTAST
jgi:CO/xanthine dehydrogenase Mo-binding subunit